MGPTLLFVVTNDNAVQPLFFIYLFIFCSLPLGGVFCFHTCGCCPPPLFMVSLVF